MKEETDGPAAEAPASTSTSTSTKLSSFGNRLQLSNFMFDNASQPRRRSPRLLQTPQTPENTTTATTTTTNTTRPSGLPTPPSSLKPKPASTTTIATITTTTAGAKRKRKSPQPTQPTPGSDHDHDGSDPLSPPKKKKQQQQQQQRARLPSKYAPPATYQHLPPLVDKLAPNLLVLFVGLNPGITTARSGHAYAHPSNLFWKLLYSSGLTPVPCKPEEDVSLPARFSLGNTNIVARPSRNGAELSKAEMDAGVAILEAKCLRWKPEVVCVVGKSIWESIFRVWKGRNMTRGEFEYGWQTERMGVSKAVGDGDEAEAGEGEKVEEEVEGEKVKDDTPWEGSRVFVATSTSGLAATLSRAEKERIWKILGDWCVQRRKERAAAAAMTSVDV